MCRMRRFLPILRSFFHSSLLCTFSCHFSPTTILPFSLTSSCHLFLGLPLNLVVPKFTYNTIIAKNKALPTQITIQLYDTVAHKRQIRSNNTQTQRKTCVTFTYHSPLNRKVTNIFKCTGMNKAYWTTNTLFNRLKNTKETHDKSQKSGVYKLMCSTCNSAYTGQTGKV